MGPACPGELKAAWQSHCLHQWNHCGVTLAPVGSSTLIPKQVALLQHSVAQSKIKTKTKRQQNGKDKALVGGWGGASLREGLGMFVMRIYQIHVWDSQMINFKKVQSNTLNKEKAWLSFSDSNFSFVSFTQLHLTSESLLPQLGTERKHEMGNSDRGLSVIKYCWSASSTRA